MALRTLSGSHPCSTPRLSGSGFTLTGGARIQDVRVDPVGTNALMAVQAHVGRVLRTNLWWASPDSF